MASAASSSEVVVPVMKDGAILGVLDLDSPLRGRFDEGDARGLEAVVTVLIAATDFGA